MSVTLRIAVWTQPLRLCAFLALVTASVELQSPFSPFPSAKTTSCAFFFFSKNFKCFYFFYDFISFLWLYYCKVYLGDIFVYYTITTLCYSRWHGLCDILPLIRQTSVKAYFFLFYSNKLRNMQTWVCCKIWPEGGVGQSCRCVSDALCTRGVKGGHTI